MKAFPSSLALRTQVALVLLGIAVAVSWVPGPLARTLATALVLVGILGLAHAVGAILGVLERIAAGLEGGRGVVPDAEAQQAEVDSLKARLEASRAVNDPEGVVDARNALRGRLAAAALEELDHDLVRWLLALIQKRMRTGTVRADIAVLAERVATTFGHIPEGASLRASLPILRRSSGLCPCCGEPYTGIEAACPECLGTTASATPPVPSLDELIAKPPDEDDPFLRPNDPDGEGTEPPRAT
jgi:hypothetical protein